MPRSQDSGCEYIVFIDVKNNSKSLLCSDILSSSHELPIRSRRIKKSGGKLKPSCRPRWYGYPMGKPKALGLSSPLTCLLARLRCTAKCCRSGVVDSLGSLRNPKSLASNGMRNGHCILGDGCEGPAELRLLARLHIDDNVTLEPMRETPFPKWK